MSKVQIRHNNITICLILSLPYFAAKTALMHWGIKSNRHLNVLYAVVSDTKMASTDLSLVTCEVSPPWIGVLCTAHPTDARLYWDLGNLACWTPQTRCCAYQTTPESLLLCGRGHYPAGRGHSCQGTCFPWKGVHDLQKYLVRWYMSK